MRKVFGPQCKAGEQRVVCCSLLGLIVLLIAVTACSHLPNSANEPRTAASMAQVTLEVNEIASRDLSAFKSSSDLYELSATIELQEDKVTSIDYTVSIEYRTEEMQDVVVTAVLPEEMQPFADLWINYITNFDATHYDLGASEGRIPGFRISRSFPLKRVKDVSWSELRAAIYALKVKVSWTDSSGKRHHDYLLLGEDSIRIDDKVFDYFKISYSPLITPRGLSLTALRIIPISASVSTTSSISL